MEQETNTSKTYNISYVKQENGRDIKTETCKLFMVGDNVKESYIKDFASSNAMILIRGFSTATNTMKIQVLDYHDECHIEALEIK